MMRADLHIHTYFSDGQQSPEDVVEGACASSLQLFAVTDHDNMNGCDEVAKLAKSKGIIAVDGIEISAYEGVKVHVLGYNLDRSCTAFSSFFERLCKGADERCDDILCKLKKHGFNITKEEVLRERKCAASPIHTIYIARAAARKGYGNSPTDFYLSYLNHGKCAYSSIGRPTPQEAVEVIKECGGISSLAHPGRITLEKDSLLELIERLTSCGLDGIEAVYSGHTESDTAYYKEIAESKKLLVTGGSDTHFTAGNRHIGTPEFYPDDKLLAALKII
jgi:hypothetical protein